MKLKVNAPKIVEEGKHEGVIIAVDFRTDPHEYTDYVIEFEGGKKMKASYPTELTPVTAHGKMLDRFGVKIEVGEEIETDKLIGRTCTFVTINKVTKNGTFAECNRDSLKPVTAEIIV